MNPMHLLVPDRPGGWGGKGIAPLLDSAEASAYAAFTSAGFAVDAVAAEAFLESAFCGAGLAVLIQPEKALLSRIERKMASSGGHLIVVYQREGEETLRRVRDSWMTLAPHGQALIAVSRRTRHERVVGWRAFLRRPSFVALRSAPDDAVAANWKSCGLPAARVRARGKASIWSLGFHPDHLEPGALLDLLAVAGNEGAGRHLLPRPVPDGVSAAVLLLHDVEEPLPDDPGGIDTVRAGLEAGLDSEAGHGFHATYNAVGTFAEKVPDLIKRIAADGHELASHGATHSVVADLDPARLLLEVEGCERQILEIAGTRVRGFRSPRSRWGDPLLSLLAERGYRWNAEADSVAFPYRVPGRGATSIVRIPVAVDDWDFVKHRASPRTVLQAWEKEVRWAMERQCWVAIGSHPSVLGVAPERLSMYDDFLSWLSSENVRVMTHSEGVTWWLNRNAAFASVTGEFRVPVARGPA